MTYNPYLLDPKKVPADGTLPRHYARVDVPDVGPVYCDDYLAQQLVRCIRDGQPGVAATLIKWFDSDSYYTTKETP